MGFKSEERCMVGSVATAETKVKEFEGGDGMGRKNNVLNGNFVR